MPGDFWGKSPDIAGENKRKLRGEISGKNLTARFLLADQTGALAPETPNIKHL
jgi:hypothetical protein